MKRSASFVDLTLMICAAPCVRWAWPVAKGRYRCRSPAVAAPICYGEIMNHSSADPASTVDPAQQAAVECSCGVPAQWRVWRALGSRLGVCGLGEPQENQPQAFWGSSFIDASGEPLQMASMRGRFAPAAELLGYLVSALRAGTTLAEWLLWRTQGQWLAVLGLAIDQPTCKNSSNACRWTSPWCWAGLAASTCHVASETTRGLPFTVMFAADGISRRK